MANDYTPQQIEEILQMFFDVAGTRQYIGARYVPIFGRGRGTSVDWDNSDAYEPLSIVYYQGDTYTSRRYVPAGITINDQDYWVITGRYNAQVEQYRQEVLSFQGQIDDANDAITNLRDDVADEYVPFPDSDHYPKFGTLGQVLTTLADGETKWEDPVVPSDEQAEEVITAWLVAHPEATTTVQDGSITDEKINDNSSILRTRGNMDVGLQSLATVTKAGYYSINSGSFNPSDAPISNIGLCEMLVLHTIHGDGTLQILRRYNGGKIWTRYVPGSGNPTAWVQLATTPLETNDLAEDTSILYNRGSVPNDATTILSLNKAGYYSKSGTWNPTDGPISNINICEVLTLAPIHGATDTLQFVRQFSSGRLWCRFNQSNTAGTWKEILTPEQGYTVTRSGNTEYENLAAMRTPGDYSIPRALYDHIADGGNSDFPSDAGRSVYSLQVHLAYDGNHVTQYLTSTANKTWIRTLDKTNGNVYNDWKLLTSIAIATTDALGGKKLVTAGDSYTHAHYSSEPQYEGKNYGYYVAQRCNMSFVNDGISGSTMALTKAHVDDPLNVPASDRSPFSYQRYANIPADTDYLTIWFGINDATNTYLGTINDATNETFYGAWNFVLEYYLTNKPFMKLGLIVTTGASPEYRQAVRDVAEKWGYPYLDWVNDVQVPAFFQRNGMSDTARDLRREAFGYDDYSAHPSPQWHEYASTIYENFLRSL